MDTLSTPKYTMSSVFLTPPFSSGKNYFDATTLTSTFPIPEFLSLTPSTLNDKEEDRCDIVSLLSGSFHHISYSILSNLKPCDLNNALTVCKTWRGVVLSKNSFMDKVFDFRKELKKEQENLYMKQIPMMTMTSSPPNTPRLPLNALSINSMPNTTVRTVIQDVTPKPSHENWRPCPQCCSPARIIQSKSQCNVCNFEFCPKCFKPSHSERKCSIATSPKKRQGNIACNSKSKKRLRRL